MKRRLDLDGAVVFITGPARGIGAEVARRAARRGARLALVGLEAGRLEALARDLGRGHIWIECDVTDQSALERAVSEVVTRLGGIDVVIANAGIANNGTVAVNPADALARTVEVNLIGLIRTVSAALPEVIRSRGHILLISSVAAFTMLPGLSAYCASKAGVEQFGNSLRLEVAHRGVTVGTAHPAWIDTDLVRDQRRELQAFEETLHRLPWPLNRITSVDECAAALVDAIERRRRRVFIPRSMAAVQALRTLVTGPIADRVLRPRAAIAVPQLEAQVSRLGRSFGATSAAGVDSPRPPLHAGP